jgi:hypothetical protein
MTLRKLMIERILFAADEAELDKQFHIGSQEVYEMADLDLFELYEALYLPEQIR